MSHNVAIDGPAGAGKSTIAKQIARRLGYIYVDTGAMYRAMAYYLIQNQVDAADQEAIAAACQHADISICYQDGEQVVLLNGENVNAYLRTEAVGNMASVSSVVPEVRKKLVELADVKVYLTASVETRAKRRFLELQEKGEPADLAKIAADIEDRDYRDMHRDISPLRQAEDATLVDSSDMTIDQVVERILELCR